MKPLKNESENKHKISILETKKLPRKVFIFQIIRKHFLFAVLNRCRKEQVFFFLNLMLKQCMKSPKLNFNTKQSFRIDLFK